MKYLKCDSLFFILNETIKNGLVLKKWDQSKNPRISWEIGEFNK